MSRDWSRQPGGGQAGGWHKHEWHASPIKHARKHAERPTHRALSKTCLQVPAVHRPQAQRRGQHRRRAQPHARGSLPVGGQQAAAAALAAAMRCSAASCFGKGGWGRGACLIGRVSCLMQCEHQLCKGRDLGGEQGRQWLLPVSSSAGFGGAATGGWCIRRFYAIIYFCLRSFEACRVCHSAWPPSQ